MNWRRAFLERAKRAVRIGYDAFMMQYPNATKKDVARWADNALNEASGCAFWEFPPTATVCNTTLHRKPAVLFSLATCWLRFLPISRSLPTAISMSTGLPLGLLVSR